MDNGPIQAVPWSEVAGIVRHSREVHEMILGASEISGTAGTCLYASFVLRLSLEKFGGCVARVRGGDGEGDGGALDADGAIHGHYWVEGLTGEGVEFVADVTANQFGHDPVYFAPAEFSRHRYQPGSDVDAQAAATSLGESIAASMYAC